MCAVEGCDRPRRARGWCEFHYRRWYRNGDPLVALPIGNRMVREASSQWKGDAIGYTALHDRLKVARGKASGHACVDCAGSARDWSLVRGATVVTDPTGRRYSLRLDDYQPRCVGCHARYDRATL
jgi:hypothetical protein